MVTPFAHPKINDWDCFPLIDFGIRLLNKIPSKRLNLEYLPAEELQNLRITNEEWNLAISPLQIVRGLTALYILADGKCKIKLANLISKALFGAIEPLGKTIHEDLNDLCINHLKSLSKGAIQIYFEENHLLKLNDELIEYIEKYYGTEFHEAEMTMFDPEERMKKEVVQTICFQMNPNGQTLVNEMNKNIKEATQGTTEYVVRQDLSPKQGTRLVLITSYNSTFYWKPSGQIMEVETFFYETYEKILHTRSVIIIPCFSIISPVGLRSVFAPCNPLYHFIFKKKHPQFPYPCIARIFSPDKAEFGMIYGKNSQEIYGPSQIYPLWDYYHKTKMALKIGQPELKKGNDDEMRAVTFTQKTMKDETMEKKHQEVVAVTGKMMIIEGQVGIDRKHYIIGILGNGNDENFDGRRIFSSFSKPKKLKKTKRESPNKSTVDDINNAVKENRRNVVNRRISQPKKLLQHFLENTMEQMGIQLDASRKKELSQQKSSKRKQSITDEIFDDTKKNSTKSSTSKSSVGNQQSSKIDDQTQRDNKENDNDENKTQSSVSYQYSRRLAAGTEIKKQISKASVGEISKEETTGKLKETTSQKKLPIFRFIKEPEIALTNKGDTIMVEQDELPAINPYFMVKEDQVKDIQADIIFDTPFLYMIVSKSEVGRFLVVSMGRFTNIQEINPPENMYDREQQ